MRYAYYKYRMNEMNMMNGATDLMTVKEVAGRLRLSRVSVYKLINRREITSHRFGRKTLISQVEVEDYVRRNTTLAKKICVWTS